MKSIYDELYLMIKDRNENPKDGSYTNYLLKEGIDKVCKKVGEEATEIVIAAKNIYKNELVGEICDLIYHIEVLMFIKDVSIEDIENKLKLRHKKECNKKIQNVRGDY